MPRALANPYLQMDLHTAAPERLVARLLERAVQLVEASADRGEGRPQRSPEAITKAVDIVAELRGALDMAGGGEIARNLDALYEFVTDRLILGHATGDAEPLREAGRVLESVSTTWRELVEHREVRP